MAKQISEEYFNRPTVRVARELLGQTLVRRTPDGRLFRGRIVETEAYLGARDLACHSAKGRTARTEPMFGPAGRAYVYLIYGMYACLNLVTRETGVPEAVLIRALEPLVLDGETVAPTRESWCGKPLPRLLNGPGKLCREFSIGRELSGLALTRKNGLWVEADEPVPPRRIARAQRVGVDYAGAWKDKLLRFYIKDSPFVSKK